MTLRRSLFLGAALLLAILSVGTRAANDTTPPTIAIDLPRDGQAFTLHEPAVARWTVSDASELKRVEATVANGETLPTERAGQHSLTVTAVDAADNRESRTHFYRVVYDAALTAPVTPAASEGEGRPRLSATAGDVIPFAVEVRDFFGRPVAGASASLSAIEAASREVVPVDADIVGAFAYDRETRTHRYALDTDALPAGDYELIVQLDDAHTLFRLDLTLTEG